MADSAPIDCKVPVMQGASETTPLPELVAEDSTTAFPVNPSVDKRPEMATAREARAMMMKMDPRSKVLLRTGVIPQKITDPETTTSHGHCEISPFPGLVVHGGRTESARSSPWASRIGMQTLP